MKTKYVLNIILSALMACMLASCQETSEGEPVLPEPEETVETTGQVPAAEQVDFSQLNDGDRVVIVLNGMMKSASSLPDEYGITAVDFNGAGRNITVFPEYTEIFTFEHAEKDSFRLKGSDGYLVMDSVSGLLRYGTEKNPAVWTMKDNVMVNTDTSSECDGFLLNYNTDHNCFLMSSVSETEAPPEILFYKVNDDYAMSEDDEKGYRLPVFETSDIHGYIVDAEQEEKLYLFPYIADKVNDSRIRLGEERKDITILLDGGDIYQGYNISNILSGEPMLRCFMMMNYDAVTIGNHEFDWNLETVVDEDGTMADFGEEFIRRYENKIPVVLCNLYQNGEKVSCTRDYVVLEKTAVDENGNELPVRIGVIGCSEDYSSTIMNSLFTGKGYELRTDYDYLAELSKQLREDENCDAVILLTHTGEKRFFEEVSERADIDLFLCGHTHMSTFGLTENNVPYVLPAGNGTAYSYAELVFDKSDDGNAVFKQASHVHPVSVRYNSNRLTDTKENEDELDQELVALTGKTVDYVDTILGSDIGYITVPVIRYTYFPGSGERSSTGGNFYTSLVAEAGQADVGFFNRWGMREDLTIPEAEDCRTVTVGDIYTLFPFGSKIYTYQLTYEEFLRLLNYSLTEEGSKLFTVMSGVDVYFTEETVNAIVKDGTVLYENGKWTIDAEKETIKVAAGEFISTTNRPSNGMDNPLWEWKDSDRLIISDTVDNTSIIRILEARSTSGPAEIEVDQNPHFINRPYSE